MSLPGYDAWKLASPPEYDAPDVCPQCQEQFEGTSQCVNCGYGEPEPEPDDHDMACDRDRDDAMEAEVER